jgi:hypothetical protein
MKRFFYLFLVVASFVITLVPPNAFAQSAACNSARAQLAALDRSGGGNGRSRQFEAAARRQNSELQRTVNYARQLGCDRGGGLFGSALPPECGTINAQIGRMRANLSSLESQAESLGGGDTAARRQQLLVSIDRNCNNNAPVQARPQQPKGLLETLFGGGEPTPPQPVPVQPALRAPPSDAFPPNSMPDLDGQVAEDEDAEVREKRRYGGSRAVCVRTCDGYFFPVNVLPDGRSGANEMCQALCPGTETQAFFMSGSGDIEAR